MKLPVGVRRQHEKQIELDWARRWVLGENHIYSQPGAEHFWKSREVPVLSTWPIFILLTTSGE